MVKTVHKNETALKVPLELGVENNSISVFLVSYVSSMPHMGTKPKSFSHANSWLFHMSLQLNNRRRVLCH